MAVCARKGNKTVFISAIVLIVAVILCLFAFNTLAESKSNNSLLQLIVIFRHGARNPTDTYNSDPYKNYQWPNGLGSLTNVGKLQLYALGKRLRNHYENFIPNDYYDSDVYIQSSDNSRCLMSAYTLLAGLYPPTEKQKWHPDIPWQPVPVHALPRLMDNIIAAKKPCARYDREYDIVRQSQRIQNLDAELKDLYAYLSLHTNGTVDNILTLEYLYSTLLTEKENGLKLPTWTDSVFPDRMENTMRTSLALFTDNDLMKRLRSGPLLKTIADNMKAKDTGGQAKLLYLYSAHDITIVSFMRTIGFTELMRPEYGASLILELHRNPAGPAFIKAFYWNDTKTLSASEMRLPLCSEPCTLMNFKQSVEHLMPHDWEAECENK